MSHRICPTCERVLPDDRTLVFMAQTTAYAPEADDISDWYEQVEKFIRFLSALAVAGPLAVYYDEPDESAEWVGNLRWLAEKLHLEVKQRMDRLATAIQLQRQQACRKEGN
jgi:hypothetical protein